MDPNETLRLLREHCRAYIEWRERREAFEVEPYEKQPEEWDGLWEVVKGMQDVPDLLIALDEWICRGGFLPAEWRRE